MNKKFLLLIGSLAVLLIAAGIVYTQFFATDTLTHDPNWPTASEQMPIYISLAGPLAEAEAEVSGLAWYGDTLILLPQYPQRLDNHLYALTKEEITAVLDNTQTDPLTPQAIPFSAADLYTLDGFEGLEAITFIGDQLYITIETSPGTTMLGYLASGHIAPDLSQIVITGEPIARIEPQADIANYSEETLLAWHEQLLTIYEANGRNVNPTPVVHLFDGGLTAVSTLPFPTIEYRLTDATQPDEAGRFWAINYTPAQSIAKLDPASDILFAQYGIGPTHASNNVVERLVEFQLDDTGISFSGTDPIQLTLLGSDEARNWEGIARLDERGFLLVTDKFPDTILAFVPLP